MLRWLAIPFVCVLVAAQPSQVWAQATPSADAYSAGRVTILTGAIGNPYDLSAAAIADLATALDDPGTLRIVPALGYGQVDNIRDLVLLQGIDMAVVNADVLRFIELEHNLAKAKRDVRSVTQLYDNAIIVVARREFATLEALAGQIVATAGKATASHVSARTLFDTHGIAVEFRHQTQAALLDTVAGGEAAATVIVTPEPERVLANLAANAALHAISVPEAQGGSPFHQRLTVPARGDGAALETVGVASLLVSYDWKPTSSRYVNIDRFIQTVFKRFDVLRGQQRNSVWRSFNPDRTIAAMPRLPSAEQWIAATRSARSLVDLAIPSDTPALASGSELVTVALARTNIDGTRGEANAADRAQNEEDISPVRIAALELRPFSGAALPNGGVVTELLTQALSLPDAAGSPDVPPAPTVRWFERLTPETVDQAASEQIDLIAPIVQTSCSNPMDIAIGSALACDNLRLSQPILQTLLVLFHDIDNPLDLSVTGTLIGMRICVPELEDAAPLWKFIEARKVERGALLLVRLPDHTACFQALGAGEVDLVLANDRIGMAAVEAAALRDRVSILETPVEITALYAGVPREHKDADAILERVDAAIASLRSGQAYGEIVNRQLLPQ